jgi:hypothetical protein
VSEVAKNFDTHTTTRARNGSVESLFLSVKRRKS